jgi:alpha,alpha-trehalase
MSTKARRLRFLAASVVLVAMASVGSARQANPAPPAVVFGKLYADVELSGIFADSKTFADAIPRRPPTAILADYRQGLSKADLRAFVIGNFDVPAQAEAAAPSTARPPLAAHIAALWPVLARPPLTAAP